MGPELEVTHHHCKNSKAQEDKDPLSLDSIFKKGFVETKAVVVSQTIIDSIYKKIKFSYAPKSKPEEKAKDSSPEP